MRLFSLVTSLVPLTLAQHYRHPSVTRSPSPTTPSIEPSRYTIPCTMSDDTLALPAGSARPLRSRPRQPSTRGEESAKTIQRRLLSRHAVRDSSPFPNLQHSLFSPEVVSYT
ncbi:hypothetical protein P171DRAFT_428091 [Karstenula rhodostoma CBS 690.94]|uniref:Uncharacterized protein n=1 Tax=Karstenula rhodostoma CBS 690.94 TaxID=1392251 RepID=A0A9P4UHW1_9PLEO|nr:hypothetical protein P171DRAFT_428091 [Karstenula rhodostoma CBS 690.94]